MSDIPVPVGEVIRKLADILIAEGSILFSNVPKRIEPYNYSDYSNGQRLKPWLLSFPQFAESEDELSLILADASLPQIPKVEQTNNSVPLSEVRCMHAFAYMNYWNQNLKHLKNLGVDLDLKVDYLRDRIAHILMRDLMTGEIAIDDSNADVPRMYLNTRFTMPTGHPVYAVLEINPLNTNGKKQFWAMKGFGTTSETDTSELGGYLRSYFSISTGFDYSGLDAQVERVCDMMAFLRSETEMFLASLAEEARPNLEDGTRFSQHLLNYEQQWQELLSLLEGFPSISSKIPQTLTEIRAVISKDALRNSLLHQAIEGFNTVCRGLEKFFDQNRWSYPDDSTIAADYRLLYDLYDHGVSQDPKLTKFQELLIPYRSLQIVMASQRADEQFYENYTVAHEHFKELPPVWVAPYAFIKKEEERKFMEDDRQYMDELDQISNLIDQYLSSDPSRNEAKEIQHLPESRDQLLEQALQADSTYCRNWPYYIKEIMPGDETLRQIILPNTDQDCELTCYAVAMRLQDAGEQGYAERYLILGLLHDKARCAPALLQLYREKDMAHEFEAVWSCYKDIINFTPDDERYLFGMICECSPEQALETAEKNLHMMYQTATLSNLIIAAETLGRTELAETFRTRLKKFSYAAEPNKFETAIINAVPEAIVEAAQPENLLELGYEAPQIQMIRNTLESGEYPTGFEAYEIGRRLFKFQGNTNNLAEYWMWQGISKRERSSYAELMLLLTNEHRWEETIKLYESNEEYQRRFEACRRFYLISRFFHSPTQAVDVFCENLQDILVIMNLRADFRDKFHVISTTTNNAFYGSLLKLYDRVSNPFMWSIVCEDRSLRDRVYDQAQMEALGLDAAKTSESYRNSKYPHGTDAASIAVRLYELAGNLFDAAETAAQLVDGDHTAVNLLWTIYNAEKNEAGMYELLVQNEWLRQAHYTAYLDFLYEYSEYALFLEALSQDENSSEHQILQRAIAELKTKQPLSDQPKVCAEIALNSDLELCKGLLQTAAASKETALITEIICTCFDSWIYSAPDQLAELVSCCGVADEEMLLTIQHNALEHGHIELAVYLSNNFKIGDIQDHGNELYLQLREELQSENAQAKLRCIQKLQCLYPDMAEDLTPMSVAITIQELLSSRDASNRKDVAQKLAEVISGLDQNTVLLDVVLENLVGSEQCWDYRVYTAIHDWGRQIGRIPDVLLFFHEATQIDGSEKKNYFRDFLIKMYYNALEEGWFPKQIAQQAEQICFLAIEQGASRLAAMCIAMLEQLMDRKVYAHAVMLHLVLSADTSEKALDELGQKNLCGCDDHPNSLLLFEQILETGTEQQIMEYLTFCSRFVQGSMGALQELRNLGKNQLTEQQSIYAIDLLCHDPEKVEYWEMCARIDFSISDAARARFLHLCCTRNPHSSTYWEQYVQICEADASSFDRLPEALVTWSGISASQTDNCRQYIEKQLQQNPEYFSRIEDHESLCLLMRNLCQKVSQQYSQPGDADQGILHSQLRATAEIAVGTSSPDCLRILHQEARHLLCGPKIDLGVMVVSRLLLAERIDEASEWIARLNSSIATIKYRSLISELFSCSIGELRQWSRVPANKTFLQLILPDGNQPNVKQITRITTDALLNGTAAETASVLKNLLNIFPDDYLSTYELMELCTTGFEGSIPLLHFSLLNLLRLPDPRGNVRVYFSRDRRTNTLALAILNKIIVRQRQMDTISDWNFEDTTAQGLENANVIVTNHSMISEIERHVEESLYNQPQEIFTLRIRAWMSNITGNWTEYLKQAFSANQPASEVFLPLVLLTKQGITRSILQLFLQTPAEDRSRLRVWLEKLKFYAKERSRQFKVAMDMEKEGILDQLATMENSPLEQILRFPTDNYGLFQNLIQPIMDRVIFRGPSQIYPTACLLCATGASTAVMHDINLLAQKYFANGQDEIAWCLYQALARTGKELMISHSVAQTMPRGPQQTGLRIPTQANQLSYNIEEYEARARVAGLFMGREESLTKISDNKLTAWSTINLVLTLAADSSGRSDEIERLISYMAPNRAYVARKVLRILDPILTDDQKTAEAMDPELTKLDRYYLTKLLKNPVEHGSRKPPYYLRTLQSALAVDYENRQIYNSMSQTMKSKCGKYLLAQNLDMEHIGAKIQMQKDLAFWEEYRPMKSGIAEYVYIAPSYAASMTAIEGSMEELIFLNERYASMLADYPNGRFADKAALSKEIYRRTLAFENNHADRYRSLLRYSVDRFYELISSGSQDERLKAVTILVGVLESGSNSVQSGAEYEALVDLVNNIGATTLFKSYPSIRSLAVDYADRKNAFTRLRGMIRDSVAFRDISTIFEVLEKLVKIFLVYDSSEYTMLIKVLDEADSMISSISGIGWAEVKGQMQRMIRAERNQLSRRAILSIQILNADEQPLSGNLQGVVTNKGTVPAENLTLQAFCGELSNNPQYTIHQLLPNGKAVFEIPYTLAEGKTRLQGHLDLNAQSCGTQIDVNRYFDFPIGESSGSSLKYRTYTTDGTGQFVYDPETRTVHNDNFFGRTVETAQMRELVEEESFADCHSAVVYGVRRTGKTSLLEYFRAYAQGSRSDCLCIRVDVQQTDVSIRSVFIDGVLSNPVIKQALESSPDQGDFLEKWKSQEDDGSFNPIVLKDFFQELKEMTGKGLILIIDEIDRLFKRMMDDHDEETLNKLLKIISGLLDDLDTKSYLHLVMCGSNWLMYYAAVGNDMQQVFQRIGDYQIRVGRLPKDDIMILLRSAQVNYTDDALQLIWEYTGGLVWFVKMLANKAISRAKENNRSLIYPADVYMSLNEVLNDNNCQQFYEGCVAGSLERKLIDAMQSQAFRKDMYLSMDKLCEMLGEDPDDLERALNGLIRFDIAERNVVNPDKVRFSLDIYRRYFRTVSSSFPRVLEEPDMFERKVDNTVTFVSYAIGEDYDDDERI